MSTLDNRVIDLTSDAAEEAIRCNWILSDFLRVVQSAWVDAHRERLKHAQWEVEEEMKKNAPRSSVTP